MLPAFEPENLIKLAFEGNEIFFISDLSGELALSV